MTKKNGKPCKQCGTSAWYGSGHCVSCKKANASANKKANLERERVRNRQWFANNHEKAKQSARVRSLRWQRENQEKVKATRHRRAARMTQAGGSFTAGEWASLCDSYGNRCLKCGKVFPRHKLTADHINPVVMGGDSNITNIQPLCKPCNSSKNAKYIDYRPLHKKAAAWMQDKLV